jgi:hypothetical protein
MIGFLIALAIVFGYLYLWIEIILALEGVGVLAFVVVHGVLLWYSIRASIRNPRDEDDDDDLFPIDPF